MNGIYYYLSSYKCSLKQPFNDETLPIESLIMLGRESFYDTLIVQYENGTRKGFHLFLDNW